ncbi:MULTISPECIES: kynureninase [Acinetobacter]|uniref:kynureninase n=1 Tax=Acinetobacter TaxID=469 RepID=UPI001F289937|nr:kynureninase [Acinetobacter johnsonii]UJA03520.1 kynureninase [Acinetobacter johnsonii]
MKLKLLFVSSIFLLGCSDPNSKAVYGESGLPKNCRALVQANIDRYNELDKSVENYEEAVKEIDGLFDSLSRNCGANGHAWGES